MSIELTADSSVTLGDAYAGIGVRVASAGNIIQAASKEGGKVILEVGDFAYAASMIPDEDEMRNTAVRYGRIADPDGYVVEVKEDAKLSPSASKLFKVVLNVIDIDESIPFYQDLLGMKLLRKRSNVMGKPKEASMCAYMVSECHRERAIKE
jgi:Glyoxalase/Bleomycin resistance protein/Dioxygenase superfamily